jgi:hypothetical protein
MTELEDAADDWKDCIAVLDAAGQVCSVRKCISVPLPIHQEKWRSWLTNPVPVAAKLEERIAGLITGQQSEISVIYTAAGQYFALIGVRMPYACKTPIILRHVRLGPQSDVDGGALPDVWNTNGTNLLKVDAGVVKAEGGDPVLVLRPLFAALDALRLGSEEAEKNPSLANNVEAFADVILQTARLIDEMAASIERESDKKAR